MSATLAELQGQMRACRLCAAAGHAIVPGAVMSGTASADIMTIGQAPGITEVSARRPFNAGSGRRLFAWLAGAGWQEAEFRARHYMTSVTKCYPGRQPGSKGDRVPGRDEQALCRPWLAQELSLVQPRVIIPIGGLAIKLFFPTRLPLHSVIGTALYLTADQAARPDPFEMRGSQAVTAPLPLTTGRYIVPLPHPSGASLWHNDPENQALIEKAITFLRALRESGFLP
jgi:uracil-DNA glycosylase